MLEKRLMPQLNEDSNDYILTTRRLSGSLQRLAGYLNRNLPQWWTGRTVKVDDALMRWPPRSLDLTPCDFFFWGFVKDAMPPLPANL